MSRTDPGQAGKAMRQAAVDAGIDPDQIDLESAIEAAPPPLPPQLVVTGAFGDHNIGDVIEDADLIASYMTERRAYVVPRYPQEEKSDTQA